MIYSQPQAHRVRTKRLRNCYLRHIDVCKPVATAAAAAAAETADSSVAIDADDNSTQPQHNDLLLSFLPAAAL